MTAYEDYTASASTAFKEAAYIWSNDTQAAGVKTQSMTDSEQARYALWLLNDWDRHFDANLALFSTTTGFKPRLRAFSKTNLVCDSGPSFASTSNKAPSTIPNILHSTQ